MTEKSKENNIFEKIKNFFQTNLRNLLIIIGIIFIIFLSFQIYNYISVNELKKTSIKFFNSIEAGDDINEALYDLQSSNNIFSTLSSLKLIQKNNNQNNFSISNEMYKELILSSELNDLLLVTEIDINKLEYKNQKEAKEMFKDIFNSSLISPSVKERVKKIHEFQIYK